MKKTLLICLTFLSILAYGQPEKIKPINNEGGNHMEYIAADVYSTSKGDLKITVVGHASLFFEFNGKVIHVDPYSKVADYNRLPKADLVVITHEHQDHLDSKALDAIKKDETHFITSPTVTDILTYGEKISNGETVAWNDISIEAVPAYNIVHKAADGSYYHPKGRGNGYIFTFGDKKVYVAGDTENVPEMENLKNSIDIAFLPRNLPYTMTNDMLLDAAKKIEPKILYPYHMIQFNDPALLITFDKENADKVLAPTKVVLKDRAMKVVND